MLVWVLFVSSMRVLANARLYLCYQLVIEIGILVGARERPLC